MKKHTFYLYLWLLSGLLIFATACSDDDEKGSGLDVVRTTIESTPVELTGTIEMNTEYFEFSINEEDEWCQIVKDKNILRVSAGANYEYNNRTAEVYIKSGSTVHRVPVTQVGVIFDLIEHRVTQMNFGLDGGERTIGLLSNVAYEPFVEDKDKDWIAVEKIDTDQYKVVVKSGTERREGKFGFRYLEKTIEIIINQFDYLTYEELIGPAEMRYTNWAGARITTDIEIVANEKNGDNGTFWIKGVFGEGIERQLLLYFEKIKDSGNELRFRSFTIDPDFTDPEKDEGIVSLHCFLYANRWVGTNWTTPSTDAVAQAGGSQYYPADFTPVAEGSLFTFVENRGWNYGFGRTGKIRGLIISGGDKAGSAAIPKPDNPNKLPDIGVNPYDAFLDIEILVP